MKTQSSSALASSPAVLQAVATVGFAVPIGLAIAVTAEPLVILAIAIASAGAAAFAMAGSDAARKSLMISVMAVSFVVTGWRLDTGFIILEPWLILFPICLVMWAGEVAVRRQFASLDRIGILALLVVLAAWLSFFGALDVMTWLKRAMKVTWLFGLYLLLVNWVSNQRQVAALIRASLWGCAAASVAIVVQMMGRWSEAGLVDVFGAGGTFANSNEAATYLAIFIVMGLALYATETHDAVMGRRSLLILIGISALGVLFTRSRSGLIGAIVVSATLFLRTRRTRRLVLAAVALLVVLSLTPSTSVLVSRLLGSVGMSGDADYDAFMQNGNVFRLYLLRLYWTVIRAYPLFGVGAGNYAFISDLSLDLPVPPPEAGIVDTDAFNFSSHNGFANWLVETGILGFVPFVASLICAAWATWHARKRSADRWWSAVALGTVGGLGIFTVTNLTAEFGVSEVRYWLLLALASVAVRQLKLRTG